MVRRSVVGFAILAGLAGLPAQVAAQAFGIGPRFSFVRGDLSTNAPDTRFLGGTIRLVTSRHTVLEGSLDYRAQLNADGTERVRETPVQGSLWLFPVRSVVSPYIGGGIGLYTQSTDTLGTAGLVTATSIEKKMGWHLGAGAEIRVARHAAFFADYRFRFVKFGTTMDADGQPITIPGSSVIPGLDKLHLSHQGSMWTSGMAFYF
jgi:opacity protein-like surface antigen